MSTLNFAPLYRSTIGFDRLFDLLDSTARTDWPPYNIDKNGENEYRITMALAGFRPDEIEVTQHGSNLTVSGQRRLDAEGLQVLHQGIASRSFKQTFNIADHVKVVAARLEHGLLSIDLQREVPEELRPKRIEIALGSNRTSGPAQLEDGRKAA